MVQLHGTVLVVEDEELIAMLLSDMLEEMGLSVCGKAATASHAVELAELHRPSLVLMDVRLEGTADGVDAALEIDRRFGIPIVFVTGSSDNATVDRIQQGHPAAILFKPILPQQLRATVEKIFGT